MDKRTARTLRRNKKLAAQQQALYDTLTTVTTPVKLGYHEIIGSLRNRSKHGLGRVLWNSARQGTYRRPIGVQK